MESVVFSKHITKIFRTVLSQLNENKTRVYVCVSGDCNGAKNCLKVRINGIIECALVNTTQTLTVNNIEIIPWNWFDCISHQKHIESQPVCVCVYVPQSINIWHTECVCIGVRVTVLICCLFKIAPHRRTVHLPFLSISHNLNWLRHMSVLFVTRAQLHFVFT